MIGTVVSDKMLSTVVVSVASSFTHPTYLKRIKSHRKYHAHNAVGAKVGDTVRISETKPVSATKTFIVVEIINK